MKSIQFKLWISEKFLGFDVVIAEKIKFENIKKRKWAGLPGYTLELVPEILTT